MGFLSSVGESLFGDPGKDIRRSSDAQLAFQREGLDYMKEVDKLPLQYRDQAMQQLMGFYSGDPGAQQGFIDQATQSPFYDQMIAQGQEGVLSQAGARGLTRSGNTTQDLNLSNQNVLQNLVNQNLRGLGGFASPSLSSGGIANQYNQMGQNVGSAGMGIAQANQNAAGQSLGLLGGLFGLGG